MYKGGRNNYLEAFVYHPVTVAGCDFNIPIVYNWLYRDDWMFVTVLDHGIFSWKYIYFFRHAFIRNADVMCSYYKMPQIMNAIT